MSKKSFKDIEQTIKNAAEAHEPAFDEESWKKMEAMLDKDKDRKRPFVFWLWWLLPLMIGSMAISYFTFYDNDEKAEIAAQKNIDPANANSSSDLTDMNENSSKPVEPNLPENTAELTIMANKKNLNAPVSLKAIKQNEAFHLNRDLQSENDKLFSKRNNSSKAKRKMNVDITAARPVPDNNAEEITGTNNPDLVENNVVESTKQEEIIIINADGDKINEKEIERIVDSAISKKINDKKSKERVSKFYVIVGAGVEANAVKLFGADKITGRFGLSAGYHINKNISIQTGFYSSSKKYVAGPGDYNAKPGSYWSTVDIKTVNANCRVYEIPLLIQYDFTPGKKLNIFATAGVSSYIMKKEDYDLYYYHNGNAYEYLASYKGNQNLFSVLKISAGVEQKLSSRFSLIAAPGLSVPLAGVGEGKVKLYSADLMIGLKFTPLQKK